MERCWCYVEDRTVDMVVLLWIGAEWSVVGVWVRAEYTDSGSIVVDWCRMEHCWCLGEDRMH